MFELPKKLKDTFREDTFEDSEKVALLEILLLSVQKAWQEAIKPKIREIRRSDVASNEIKGHGVDFFTEADVESEKIITNELIKKFGESKFRIFGEEENRYTGNSEAVLTVRIDPIDGTENFKFGKPNWSIMAGVYTGRGAEEKQIVSVTYYPEYYNELLYCIDDKGVFISNVSTGETENISQINDQNDISNIIIAFAKNNNLEKRDKIDKILLELEKINSRVRCTAPTEVRDALLTGGRRAILIDGGWNQVDFIAFSTLFHFGYRVFDWNGYECSIDDPETASKKVVIIPPGDAGIKILEVIQSVFNTGWYP